MDLLERAPLLDELASVLASTAVGGRVVLVAGEAGIGKSALVKRFTERHSADARFLLGACDPLLTPRALGPLHDIARQTGGRLAELLASGGPREAVFAAFLDELDHGGRPRVVVVVVVEDAHWADEATLDLLVFLGRRMDRTRALLLVTYRDDELAVDHPLRAVVGRLAPEAVRHLRLPPLSEAAVAELARRAGRPAAGLRALTGGNPLLVTEVLAAGDAGVPLTVRDLVLARFGALPADAQEVVRLVAVVPTRAELWLLEAAVRPAPSAVEAGVSAGLLAVSSGAVGFRHELLRQAVEGSLSVLARRELNRRVLEVLAGAPEREVDLARLVHHAREAGDVQAVLGYGPEAARQAAAVAAHREAVGHHRAVLAHADRLPPEVRAELLEGYSVEAYLSGLSSEAVAAREEAVVLREAASDQERLGETLRWLSRLHWWDGNRREAEAAAVRAVAVLEPLPPGRQLAMAYSNQAQLDMLANRAEAAMGWAGRAIELARRLDDAETLSHALANIGSARLQNGDPAGRVELEQAFQVAVEAGLEDHAARAVGNLATIAAELRDYRHARQDLDRALAFVQAHELTGWVQHVLGHRARVRLDQGEGRAPSRTPSRRWPSRSRAVPGWWTPWYPWGCSRRAVATTTPRPPSRRPPRPPSPPASSSGSRRWRRPGPSTPGCTGTTAEPPRRRLACSSRRCGPPTAGSPASWPAGCGSPGRRCGRRRWWPSRTGCCWPATGAPPPTPGRRSAAPTSGPWRWPAATRTRPCWRRWPCWTAWAPGRRPCGCGASCGGAAAWASPAARPEPRPPTRPASPPGRSRCSGCSGRA
jgi:tetratricopeptide (TPR) repeat protein